MIDPAREPLDRRPFTVLLRLLPQQGGAGRLVGHAEVIATGEQVALSSADDLVALVVRLSGGHRRDGEAADSGNDRHAEVSTTAIGEIH